MNVCFFSALTTIARRMCLCLLVGALAVCNTSVGQTISGRKIMMFGAGTGSALDTVYLDIDQDIAVQLIPFDDMVKMAVANSPLIKYQNELANTYSASTSLARTQILQNVSGFANYGTGNQALVSTGTVSARDNILQIANGYRVGVELRMTLFDLFGRKHLIQQAESNYRAASVQKETIALGIKRELIVIYQDMITAQQVLKVRLTDEQASLAAMRIAEVENQQGKATADQVAMATNRYAQAKTFSEETKGQFLKNVHQFEALLGVPIQRLKRIN